MRRMTKTPTTSASAPRSRGCVVCIARSPPRSAGSPCPSTDSSADASTAHVGPACGTKISSAGRRGRARRPARRGRSSVSLRRAGREDGVPRVPSYCALVHAEDDQGPVAARRRGPGRRRDRSPMRLPGRSTSPVTPTEAVADGPAPPGTGRPICQLAAIARRTVGNATRMSPAARTMSARRSMSCVATDRLITAL